MHFIFLWHSTSLAAGFREIEAQGVRFGLWYPSDAPVKLQRLGPFETEMAWDGPIREGQYEVVLFSHGNGGRYRNHYLTAQVLTDAGFKAMAELIAFCESGNDHDARPMHYRLENVGHEINLATFSRLREVNQNSTFSVLG